MSVGKKVFSILFFLLINDAYAIPPYISVNNKVNLSIPLPVILAVQMTEPIQCENDPLKQTCNCSTNIYTGYAYLSVGEGKRYPINKCICVSYNAILHWTPIESFIVRKGQNLALIAKTFTNDDGKTEVAFEYELK